MPSPPLSTVGLAMPDDFPFGPYEAVNARVSSHQVVQAAAYTEFAGAWRAIPYRFYAVADHGDAFTQSIAHHGATVPAPQRYLQERELFNFFVNGLAAIESFCYGLFAI